MKIGRALLLSMLCLALCLPSVSWPVQAQAAGEEENLALSAEMTASGHAGSFTPAMTQDGKINTRWAAPGNGTGSWLQAGLGQARAIHRIVLKEYNLNGGEYRTDDFKLQISGDGSEWTDIVADTGIGPEKAYTFDPAYSAGYVRLFIETAANGPHIAEFEIYSMAEGGEPELAAPTGVSGEAASGMVYVAWQAVEGASSYKINRADAATGSVYQTIGTAAGTRYIDWTAENGIAYSYRITAVNGSGESLPSASVTLVPGEPAIQHNELNIARQNAVMSASGYAGTYQPELANDGSITSRWAGPGMGSWLQADFAETVDFDKIVIREFKLTDGYRSLEYDIQVSHDGDNWTSIASGYGIGPAKAHAFAQPVAARFVRLLIGTTSGGGPHIAELEIYQKSIVPQWPSGQALKAADITQTGLKLQWEPALDPEGEGIVQYRIMQDLKKRATVPADQLEYAISVLDSNTPYSFSIQAQNQAGNWTSADPFITIRTLKEVYYLVTYSDTPRSAAVKVKDSYPSAAQDVHYSLAAAPGNGTVVLDEDGSFTYTPASGYSGMDTFTVEGTDGIGKVRTAVVQFYVQGPEEELAPASTSSLVYPGADGRLVYAADEKGNIIPDFSNVGYMGGDEAIPDVPVRLTLEPLPEGDDTARIQAAIDEVSLMEQDGNGVRGAVLLKKGHYRLDDTLYIRADGVVLRGEGQGEDGTVLHATAARQYDLILVEGTGSRREIAGTRSAITDSYVPVGTRTFTVEDPSLYEVGDPVVIYRPSTEEWIRDIGMDRIPTRSTAVTQWQAGTFDLEFERTITAIDGNRITVDAPVVNAMEEAYGGGAIYKYEFPGRIRQVGVELLRMESYYNPALGDQDEEHGWTAIGIDKAEHAWVRKVTARYFGYNTVYIKRGAKYVTVEDSEYLDGISTISGGRRYSFYIEGQLSLVQRVYSRNARHDFSLSSRVPGPNVFLYGVGEGAMSASEPHHRWSAGALFDNISLDGPNSFLTAVNRGDSGSGHGWAGAQMVFWNSRAPMVLLMSPPTANNYAIGITGYAITRSYFHNLIESNMDWIKERSGETFFYKGSPFIGNAYFESPKGPVTPDSLYLKQLQDRLTAQLWPVITAAQQLLQEASPGWTPGSYPPEAVEALQTALNQAVAVRDQSGLSLAEANAAAEELEEAIGAFREAVIGDEGGSSWVPPLIIPGQEEEPEQAEEVRLEQSGLQLSFVTDEAGLRLAQVEPEEAALAEGLALAEARSAEALVLEAELAEHVEQVRFLLPGSWLDAAASRLPELTLSLRFAGAEFNMTVGAPELQALVAADGEEQLAVYIRRLEGRAARDLAEAAAAAEAEVQGVWYGFRTAVRAADGNGEREPDGPERFLASVVIPAWKAIDARKTTAVYYDEAAGRLAFAPSVPDGENGVRIRHNGGNRVYGIVAAERAFADMAGHWAQKEVEQLATKLLLEGREPGEFAPEAWLSRAELAAVLVRALVLPPAGEGKTAFADVDGQEWYAPYVAAAREYGLAEGDEQGAFRPQGPVTREQLAVFLSRLLQYASVRETGNPDNGLSRFADQARISPWAREAVAVMVQTGIIQGLPDGIFAPGEQASRAQAAVMLSRALKHMGYIS